nr:MAG TPA: hypothetical protein [Crassvirales sp.]
MLKLSNNSSITNTRFRVVQSTKISQSVSCSYIFSG